MVLSPARRSSPRTLLLWLLLPSRSGVIRRAKLDPIEAHEALVARGDHFLALLESPEHLVAFGIAAAEAHVPALGEVTRRVDDEHPLAARVVEERAVREHERVGGLADLETHPQRLPAPDHRGRIALEQQIDIELPVRALGIDVA